MRTWLSECLTRLLAFSPYIEDSTCRWTVLKNGGGRGWTEFWMCSRGQLRDGKISFAHRSRISGNWEAKFSPSIISWSINYVSEWDLKRDHTRILYDPVGSLFTHTQDRPPAAEDYNSKEVLPYLLFVNLVEAQLEAIAFCLILVRLTDWAGADVAFNHKLQDISRTGV